MSKLQTIRGKMNVKKSKFNEFGKFNYRTVDDILNTLTPLLVKYDAQIRFASTMLYIGERHYAVVDCYLQDDQGIIIESRGFAREPLQQKGMNDPQMTGSAFTYAKKNALNDMFLLDADNDPDSLNNEKRESKPEKYVPTKKTFETALMQFEKDPTSHKKTAMIKAWQLTDEQIEQLNKILRT